MSHLKLLLNNKILVIYHSKNSATKKLNFQVLKMKSKNLLEPCQSNNPTIENLKSKTNFMHV